MNTLTKPAKRWTNSPETRPGGFIEKSDLKLAAEHHELSPATRAAMLSDLFAGLLEGEDMAANSDDARDIYDTIWPENNIYGLSKDGQLLGSFCAGSIVVPNGFHKLESGPTGIVSILLEETFDIQLVQIDEINRKLSHGIVAIESTLN
jgi:hypothetical protein